MIALTLALLAPAADVQAAPPVPCPVISRPTNHWGAFAHSLALPGLRLRVTAGVSDCRFERLDRGRCLLLDPRTFVATVDGQDTWYELPAHRAAEVEVTDGRLTCAAKPMVRMD